jgi:hypothetical protein
VISLPITEKGLLGMFAVSRSLGILQLSLTAEHQVTASYLRRYVQVRRVALLGQFDFPESPKLPLTEDDKPGFTVSAVCPLKGPRVEKSRVNVDLGF